MKTFARTHNPKSWHLTINTPNDFITLPAHFNVSDSGEGAQRDAGGGRGGGRVRGGGHTPLCLATNTKVKLIGLSSVNARDTSRCSTRVSGFVSFNVGKRESFCGSVIFRRRCNVLHQCAEFSYLQGRWCLCVVSLSKD